MIYLVAHRFQSVSLGFGSALSRGEVPSSNSQNPFSVSELLSVWTQLLRGLCTSRRGLEDAHMRGGIVILAPQVARHG